MELYQNPEKFWHHPIISPDHAVNHCHLFYTKSFLNRGLVNINNKEMKGKYKDTQCHDKIGSTWAMTLLCSSEAWWCTWKKRTWKAASYGSASYLCLLTSYNIRQKILQVIRIPVPSSLPHKENLFLTPQKIKLMLTLLNENMKPLFGTCDLYIENITIECKKKN